MLFQSVNPFTGQLIRSFQQASEKQVNGTLENAQIGFENWKNSPMSFRVSRLRELAQLLDSKSTALANIMAIEMGKPIIQGESEIQKCHHLCNYYASHGPDFLETEQVDSDANTSYLRYDPLGCILLIMPWNYPFWQVFRAAVPAIMAGNTVLLKHAPNVPQCSEILQDLFEAAGFPKGVFQQIFINHEQAAEVIADDIIRGVALTGSDRAGREVAALAGKHLKPCVLELGGSDPFIVLEDADLQKASWFAAKARFQNAGQTCIAAKRFFIHHSVFQEFSLRLRQHASEMPVGDPRLESTLMGPMARPDLVEKLEQQVARSLKMGARKLLAGGRDNISTCIYHPEIITGLKPGMPVTEEEVFGPVAVMDSFETTKEALQKSNNTRFGLGASIWTTNIEEAEKIAAQLEAGTVAINGMVKSNPALPFGGIKDSGFGRELGKPGILSFVNVKTVVI